MKLRPCSGYQKRAAEKCEQMLRECHWLAGLAGCPKLRAKVFHAVKSAGGAVRHAQRRFNARKVFGVLHVTATDRTAFSAVEKPAVNPVATLTSRRGRAPWYKVGQYA